jgi:hypothetical protein
VLGGKGQLTSPVRKPVITADKPHQLHPLDWRNQFLRKTLQIQSPMLLWRGLPPPPTTLHTCYLLPASPVRPAGPLSLTICTFPPGKQPFLRNEICREPELDGNIDYHVTIHDKKQSMKNRQSSTLLFLDTSLSTLLLLMFLFECFKYILCTTINHNHLD